MRGWREKAARNQALFREVNEQIERLPEGVNVHGYDSFICECGNPECTEPIALTRAEYERVREHANRFAVALDHQNPDVETIVERNDRFTVVETCAGEASQIAQETDPRSQARTRIKRSQPTRHAAEGSP